MRKRPFFLLIPLLLSLCACAVLPQTPMEPVETKESETTASVETESTETMAKSDPILQMLSNMTLREKVGQLFIVRPDSLDLSLSQDTINDASADGVQALTAEMEQTLREYPVGGIVQFGKNIDSPEQLSQFNAQLQEASDIPLFISVDEEGGLVARLANHKAFTLPKYESAASIEDFREAIEMGSVIGNYLSKYGFNMDFAPVADVNTNPDNPIIGTRAFSSAPDEASELASAMAEGLRQQGVIAVYKHFPGHGDTAEDSHSGIAITYKTKSEMSSCEWIPFHQAKSDDCIMVGHIAAPEITGDLTPASLSRTLVTDILKGELGFEGLVVTDSLAMGAVTESYTPGQAALAALNAGCDLLLMPNGLTEAFDAVVSAVEDGTFPEETLDAIVTRILTFKQAHGLLDSGDMQ